MFLSVLGRRGKPGGLDRKFAAGGMGGGGGEVSERRS